jgi:putative peptide zinc metalloprotease protein
MAGGTVTPRVADPAAASASPELGVPRLARGVELIGRFEDSGFKEPPYLARRGDGQVVQLAPLLYALADEIDGRRDTAQIAEALSHRVERQVTPDIVEMLLDEQLRRLGVVAGRDGVTGEVRKVDPLLALKFKTKVVPARLVRALTTVFRPLFLPPVVAAVLLAFVGLDVWLFGVHGISQGLRHVLYQPALLLLLVGGVVVATAFHEIGHATAVRYGGAEPGVMGVGVYIVWPAFYTDITDAYRLGKWGRLRADTGGMYFNAVFALATAAAYVVTGFEPLLLLVLLQNFAIFQQALPFLRLDGYYIISDLTGVPDILSRIRPVLASLVPGRPADDRVTELKPWVRYVVTGYLLVLLPVLALLFVVMLMHAPRAFATAYDSLAVRYERVGPELSAGRTPQAVMDVFQMIVLALPCLGMAYTTSRVAHRAGMGAWGWSAGAPLRRGAVVAGTAAALGLVAYVWWPNGDYRPIQPQEKGTLLGAVRAMSDLPGGRPGLTAENERALGGAPTVRELRRDPRAAEAPVGKEPRSTGRTRGEQVGGDAQPGELPATGGGTTGGGTTGGTGPSPGAAPGSAAPGGAAPQAAPQQPADAPAGQDAPASSPGAPAPSGQPAPAGTSPAPGAPATQPPAQTTSTTPAATTTTPATTTETTTTPTQTTTTPTTTTP